MVNSNTRSAAPTVSAHCSASAISSWRSTCRRRPPTLADHRRRRGGGRRRTRSSEPPGHVEAAAAGDRHAVGPGRHEHLGETAAVPATRGHQEPVGDAWRPRRRPWCRCTTTESPSTSAVSVDGGRRSTRLPARRTPRWRCGRPPTDRGAPPSAASSLRHRRQRGRHRRSPGRNGPGATSRPISSATMTASTVGLPRQGCRRRAPPGRTATSNRARRPGATTRARSRRDRSHSSRTVVSGACPSRNRRVVSRKNSWSSVNSRFTLRCLLVAAARRASSSSRSSARPANTVPLVRGRKEVRLA